MFNLEKKAEDLHELIHGKRGLCCRLPETLAHALREAYEVGRIQGAKEQKEEISDV